MATTQEHPGTNIQLILVDDEVDFIEELAEGLEAAGFSPIASSHPSAVLELVQQSSKPTLIITDLRMPEMDGFALMKAIKVLAPCRDIKFIVLTGHAAAQDMDRALTTGASACIRKPASSEEILEAISKIWS